jgi:hypothetical protein
VGVAKKAVRNGKSQPTGNTGIPSVDLKEAKGLTQGPSAKRTKELLKLNRNQLRWVVGLLAGHCHLKDTFSNWDEETVKGAKGA